MFAGGLTGVGGRCGRPWLAGCGGGWRWVLLRPPDGSRGVSCRQFLSVGFSIRLILLPFIGDSAGAGAAWRWWGSRYFPAAHGKTADRTDSRGQCFAWQGGGGGVPLFVLTGITITRDENSRIGGTRSPSTPPGGTHPGAFPSAGNSRLWEKCRFGRPGGLES